MANIKVVKNAEKPESKEILAEAIIRIGSAMDALAKSGLNERAIIILIQAETKLAARDIREVLGAMRKLKGWYCR
jgi:hypothetical protein